MSYQCPLCQTPLALSHRTWRCINNHSFDIAKDDYVNLMPVQHKHSKEPGDNQDMMQARRHFLDAGYYQPLRDAVYDLFQQHISINTAALLDIGCGEGYYTGGIMQYLKPSCPDLMVYGLDIAKGAVRSAAKRYKETHFCVASSYRLPFTDHSLDGALRIYAPCQDTELARVIKSSGILITVTPAPHHLEQLKALIYPNVKLHNEAIEQITGFTLQKQQRLSYQMALDCEQRLNLLKMTPFGWRANEEVIQKLIELTDFICDADFYICLYRKE
ncbi:23S rRNA (guanine(745)-N(1))-methyltransferase [Orbus wheelerorum]|uniref:23S rRNA (guanine(745)-N(1))-methyltransferase n=1 Tax=Orbus wheelerorum TaxID=3074111 RepID=UPI00370D7325